MTFIASGIETALKDTSDIDAVLAFNLLHLVPDLPAALSTIRGAMSPGQIFISKSACLSGKPLIYAMVALMRAVGRAPYVGFFKIPELEAMIRTAGFEIVETGTFPAKPPSRFIVARAV